jgi:N-acetyl-gamma-glutamyl-phosphate reductase
MMHKYSSAFSSSVSVSVVGARGYSGLELVKLLLRHPGVELQHCFATREFRLSDEIMDAKAAQVQCHTDEKLWDNLTDVVFLATPIEASAELAPKIVARGKTVIDLSGAFRFSKDHAAEYGLVPFCGPVKAEGHFVSNPGCYATAINLALIPLFKHALIEADGLVIDAKSGTTGAGRKAGEHLLFSEVGEECAPYRVGKHQHMPEIQAAVQAFGATKIDPFMTTHLLPIKRGIVAAMYAKSKTTDLAEIQAAFDTEYRNYPLVRHGADVAKWTRLQNVVGTPYAHISYTLVGEKLYLFSAIDNLLKGAASQAVENLNRLLDLPAEFSLTEGVHV